MNPRFHPIVSLLVACLVAFVLTGIRVDTAHADDPVIGGAYPSDGSDIKVGGESPTDPQPGTGEGVSFAGGGTVLTRVDTPYDLETVDCDAEFGIMEYMWSKVWPASDRKLTLAGYVVCHAAQGMATTFQSVAGDLISNDPVLTATSSSWLEAYRFCFAIAVILFLAVMLLVTAKTADGAKVDGFAMVKGSGIKAIFFYPAMMVLPAIVLIFKQISDGLAVPLASRGIAEGTHVLLGVVDRYSENYMFGVPFNAPGHFIDTILVYLLLMILGVIAALTMWVELVIAQFGAYVVACVMPMVAALSIYPSRRGAMAKTLGVLVGLVFLKPALMLCTWIAMLMAKDALANTISTETGVTAAVVIQAIGTAVIALLIACFVSALTPMVLSYLTGEGIESAMAKQAVRSSVQRATYLGDRTVSNAMSRHGRGGPSRVSSGRGQHTPGQGGAQGNKSVNQNHAGTAVTVSPLRGASAPPPIASPAAPVMVAGQGMRRAVDGMRRTVQTVQKTGNTGHASAPSDRADRPVLKPSPTPNQGKE